MVLRNSRQRWWQEKLGLPYIPFSLVVGSLKSLIKKKATYCTLLYLKETRACEQILL